MSAEDEDEDEQGAEDDDDQGDPEKKEFNSSNVEYRPVKDLSSVNP